MLFVIMLVFFIILSGKLTWDVLVAGVIVCALADVLMCKALGWNADKSRTLSRRIPFIISYAARLFAEILKANIAVIRIIISPKLGGLEPTLFTFDSGLKSDVTRTALADSITITPGTITVRTDGSGLTVHRLGDGFAFGDEMCFIRSLRALEEKEENENA